MTREQWLLDAIEEVRPWFDDLKFPLPPAIRVSMGWSKRPGKNAVGWCWIRESDAAAVNQIFISPELDSATRVMPVLLHELIHAADNGKSKHAGDFRRIFKAVGFIGKATECTPGEDLAVKLHAVAEKLGHFPHGRLNPGRAKTATTQGTRMLKLMCPADEYTVRTTQKWLDVGMPTCPCGEEMELA